MQTRHSFAVLVLTLALSFASFGDATAQQAPISFDARGGIGFPVGDLGTIADLGPAFNLGANFGVGERLFLRVTGGAEMYQGVEIGEPLGNEGINDLEVDLIHFHAGGLYNVVPRGNGESLSVSLTGTAGMTNLHVPRLAASVGTDAIEFRISELYFSAAGGASVAYAVHEQVDLFLDGHAYVVFGDENDTAEMVQVVNSVQGDQVDALDRMWSIPVTAGVRLHF